MEDGRIPVTIITGFLGAGKTTFLNNLIQKYPEKKFAIIENEFGEIGIDSGLIIGADENIFELSNGCICCSLNNDFFSAIDRLLKGPYEFNHLLIETTGIANPLNIVKPFIDNTNIQYHFKIGSVICLADAENMEDMLDEQKEVEQQLALSDIVLLNKIDLVHESYVAELKAKILKRNPMATVHPVEFAKVDSIDLLDTFSYSGNKIEMSTLKFAPLSGTQSHDTHSHHHEHEIVSEGFVFNEVFDLDLFSLWMRHYLYFNKSTIFRVKGILGFHDMPERYIFHAVKGSFVFDQGREWAEEKPFSKLVFIGKHIDRDALLKNLQKLVYKKEKVTEN
ncbi:GTP-binding protein [Maribellus comscasis]|uniref:GTP-binding protein n=1 Tax=Maribellus comscasis TaxID=2681766 RepID=A0A6I6JM78_9BACT|nr:GTP-binding protein [Maribellus comscasis]QGY43986.1 GTP-binding protein [Maribellus comscasis]